MILKTYARVFTHDAGSALETLRPLHKGDAHLRFRFGELELIAIGDMLIVAGTEEALTPIRDTQGPVIVGDLGRVKEALLEAGAEITQDIVDVPTGRMLYARHRDSIHVEYVEWRPELVEQFIRAPQREGLLSSEI
ncbi:VOC family protein [Paenirhodobacter populi]|uniref:VOC family protein n=1 Tax=Paenirhodobacter populi TaxID=2306993 RepID=A0A443JGJ1_9RHOB|nr:VOC family protein [Sinirhodobacter populi]RWR19544.1 VOC family protein [Sinirhodobacter populi]